MITVAEMNGLKDSADKVIYLHKEIEDPELIPALYMYGNNVNELKSSLTIDDNYELASIETLRKQFVEQKAMLEKGLDSYGSKIDFSDISPWMLSNKEGEGLIVCKEGIFEWSWEKEKYEFIGKIRRTDRHKIVTFLKDSKVNFGKIIHFLEQHDTYLLDGEYVAYDMEMKPVVMLVLHQHGYVPIAVPYDNKRMVIRYQDFVAISYYK